MPVRRVRLRTPAKINLDLRVLHRRPDGYHELRTIFQTISLADILEVEHEPGGRFAVDIESQPEIPDNLIAQAAVLLNQHAKIGGRWRFRLQKTIPMGAGLGGGSTNAAAPLLAMPVLAGKQVPLETLLEIAAELGSDISFFLLGGTAAAIGRGTELFPLEDALACHGVLVAPGIHVSTAGAYRTLGRKLTTDHSSSILNSFQSLVWRTGECVQASDWNAQNDFERAVFEEHPRLKRIRNELRNVGARLALMSGSGSSIFGLFESRDARDRALTKLAKISSGGNKLFPIFFLSRSSYRALWRRQLRAHTKGIKWPPQSRYCP